MKISKKDKLMLGVLGIVVVGFLYYEFIYRYQINRIAELNQQNDKVQEEYNNTMEIVNSLPKKKSDMKILDIKIGDKTTKFYPKLIQEKIILELDKLLQDSSLTSNISFNPIVVQGIEGITIGKVENGQSSLSPIAEEYKQLTKTDDKNNSTQVQNKTNSNNTSTTQKTSETVEQFKVSLNFSGTYKSLKDFLNRVDNSDKTIVVNTLSLTQKSIDEIAGTITLEFYSIPKLDDADNAYLSWTLNDKYGKAIPFSTDGKVGDLSTIETLNEKNKSLNDFVISAKSNKSDLPTVMVGKTNDSSRISYVYADSNKEEQVEFTLTKKDNRYYYKYRTSNEGYPVDQNELGVEFIPSSENITIQVLSENRVNLDDKSGIKLKLINNTDKLINVEISDDPSENPRVKVAGEGNKINVSQK